MDIVKLIEYNTWANRQIAERIEKLPPESFTKELGGSFGSLRATMVHLLESDWLWLQRWKGVPLAAIPTWDTSSAASVHSVWASVQEESLQVGTALAATGNPDIHFVTRKGVPFTLPFAEIVLHLSHHGSYHRGQLTNLLRMVGGETVGTDYFLFYAGNRTT